MVDTNPSDNLVDPQDACPHCGQRDADKLEWLDDEQVQCLSCWTLYAPPK